MCACAVLFVIGTCTTEYIFAVRTWAMWGFDRKVGMVLVTTYLACWLPNVFVALFFGHGAKSYLPPTPLVYGCNEASASSALLHAVSGMLIVYWLVLIGLMVAKGGSPWKSLFREDLFNILYRDGAFDSCVFIVETVLTWDI
ncbi:hypothetical protein FIBSPDRAFT_1043319 [Athelia psychrophila]|uniref:Uncharacterized protein n=1 Tax=Athelia psychrophila TaxID=1759441 RepID=A0A166L9K8_9AGAM|nr:hypothetical protein FIBSPDRAFT_1043319 [Fibularhizoctonia sp. CBS 109695]